MDKRPLTKYGQFMYDLTMSWTKFMLKHRVLYYILSLTWGIFLTVVGGFVTLALLICGIKPVNYYWVYYMKVKRYWGGFETGLMFVRDTTSSEHINKHEFGHTFQNTLFGPFNIFLTSIPSVCRYWYREIRERRGKPCQTDYDDIWFERSATDCGTCAVRYLQILSAITAEAGKPRKN